MNNKKNLKNGSYSILITVVVIVAAVLINLIIGSLPSQFTQLDFSTSKLYTLTDTTKTFLDGLQDDVTLYYICEGGKEDDTISKLLDRYNDASSHVTVEQVDPALYPGFTGKYTQDAVANNSVIAVNGDVSRVVADSSMYIKEFDYASYSYVTTGFDGEGMITSAIDYVTSDDIPVLYVLNGNGEVALGDSVRDAIAKNNIDLAELNLLSADEIPSDAAGILICGPTKDYTADEAKKITDYLENGGKALIFSDYNGGATPNFDGILANYGVSREEGIVLEGDSGKYMTYQYCLLPAITYTEVSTDLTGSYFVLTPMAQGIKKNDTYRKSITMAPILETSAASYAKVDVQNMTTSEKESGDIDGPFIVGMMIQEDINRDDAYDTEIAYFSTSHMVDEDYNANVAGGNAQLLGGAAGYLFAGDENSISVPAKNLQVSSLTLTDFSANVWAVICVFILPALFIAYGVVVWVKRRKR